MIQVVKDAIQAIMQSFRASKALGVEILCADYLEALRQARHGDWIYLDPPYIPDRESGDFYRYTPD